MERPIMNPTFVPEGSASGRHWYDRFRPVLRALRVALRLLLADVLRRRAPIRVDIGTKVGRFARGVCYRLLFLPLIAALMACALVYTGTHPPTAMAVMDPTCQGIYYDPVDFLNPEGNVKLEGWLVPVLDARKVLSEKDKVLNEKHPAVVLVHDFGASRQQMLPLVRPLHEAGYVVLVLGLRGTNASQTAVGSTFGINEAGDVRASLDVLRKAAFIDKNKLAVIGMGTGANAAVLAAERDPSIGALVLDQPCHGFEDVIRERIGSKHPYLRYLNPLCEWTFAISYGVNPQDLNLEHGLRAVQGRAASAYPILMFDGPHPLCLRPDKARQIVDFLDAGLGVKRNAD